MARILLVLLVVAAGCSRQTEKAASEDAPAQASAGPFAPGHRYDDREQRIEYKGSWWPDHQFPQASGQSITYSEKAGSEFRVAFTGTAITYVYTQAANRGIAEVKIDGIPQGRIDQYSPQTVWQAIRRFGGLNPGSHTLEVRVTGDKDPKSAGIFVDLDAFEVEP